MLAIIFLSLVRTFISFSAESNYYSIQCNKQDSIYSIFDNNPDIKEVLIELNNKEPAYITLLKNHKEYYDLSFNGDLYWLKTKYQININNLDFDSFFKKIENKNKVGNIQIDRKSIKFIENYSVNMYIPAEYNQPWNDITNHLNSFLEKSNLNLINSVYLFQGIIDTEGNIEYIKLIEGEEDEFSLFTADFFYKKRESWSPFMKDMRNYRSLVDIFITISKNKIEMMDYSTIVRQLKIDNPKENIFLFYKQNL